MPNEFQDANRQGVAMLQNGNYNDALASFRRAFTGVRESVVNVADLAKRTPVDRSHPHTQPEGTADDERIRVESETLISSVALGDCEPSEGNNALPGNLFSVYNHAFVFRDITLNLVARQQEIERDTMLTTQSTVILFNTALTYHRNGLLGGPKSSKYLRKALTFYSMASGLLWHHGVFENIFVIQLAAWNNMGYIYSHFSDYENAMKYRSCLYHSLFEDTATTLHFVGGSPYAIFYLFTVGSEVRRRAFDFSSEDREE
jgi:tetratricopeptide (TPR) repeat protein